IWAGASSSSPQYMVEYNGRLYFRASDGTTAPGSGSELWRTDGTTLGTVLAHDVYAGTSSSSPWNLTVYKGLLYFTASGTVPSSTTLTGTELWKTDGTTLTLIDVRTGTSSSSPGNLTVTGT